MTVKNKKDDEVINIYRQDEVYDLPNSKALHYISKGWAIRINNALVPANNTFNKFQDTFTESVYGTKQPKQFTNHFSELNKTNTELNKLLNTLGLIPKPQKRITLPIQDPNLLKRLKNKELAKDIKTFFNDKDIKVVELVKMLSVLLEYGVDIKDDELISRVASDLLKLKRLTDYYYGQR
jgi:hypothetical protein